MRLISISTDRKIFSSDSGVRVRMKEYGSVFDEFHIVVFSLKSLRYKKTKIAENVWVYPTNSLFKIFYVIDAFRVARKVYKNIKKEDNIAVTTQDPFETGFVGWLMKRRYGLYLNIQIHADMFSPFFSYNKLVCILQRIHIFPKVITIADSVRAVSLRTKKSLISVGIDKKKITVLPVFVDKNRFDQFQDVVQKEKTLIAVSRLTKEKNLFFLIDVMGDVVDQDEDVRLILVGDGPLRGELELYIQEKNMEHYIELVGWSNDVSRWYKKAGAFIHTSLYEGYGIVFIEAALQHIPIISSDVGLMGDVFLDGKSACVCPVNEKDCFVKTVQKIFKNKDFGQEIADNAHSKVLKHLPENKKSHLEKFSEMFRF